MGDGSDPESYMSLTAYILQNITQYRIIKRFWEQYWTYNFWLLCENICVSASVLIHASHIDLDRYVYSTYTVYTHCIHKFKGKKFLRKTNDNYILFNGFTRFLYSYGIQLYKQYFAWNLGKKRSSKKWQGEKRQIYFYLNI